MFCVSFNWSRLEFTKNLRGYLKLLGSFLCGEEARNLNKGGKTKTLVGGLKNLNFKVSKKLKFVNFNGARGRGVQNTRLEILEYQNLRLPRNAGSRMCGYPYKNSATGSGNRQEKWKHVPLFRAKFRIFAIAITWITTNIHHTSSVT